MADIIDPATRSRMMAAIRSRDTKPEVTLRRALHSRGFRFRLHDRQLPGRPDIVLPRYRSVVLVNGCFWQRHGCNNSRLPSTRVEFWRSKLDANVSRDLRNQHELAQLGWRVAVVWECEIREAERNGDPALYERLAHWLYEAVQGGG